MRAPTKLKPQARTLPAPKQAPSKSNLKPSPADNDNNQSAITLRRLEPQLWEAAMIGIDADISPRNICSFRADLHPNADFVPVQKDLANLPFNICKPRLYV